MALTCIESGKQVGFEAELEVAGKVIAEARDVELTHGYDEIDASTRSSGARKQWIMGMSEWQVTADQLYVFDDEGRQALESAHFNRQLVTVRVRDKDGNGYEGCGWVREFTFGQPLNDVVTFNVVIRGHDALSAFAAAS